MDAQVVREALAAAVAGVEVIGRCDAWVPSNINAPQGVVMDGPVDYDLVLGGGADETVFVVQVYVSRTSDRKAQQLLNDVKQPTGDRSVKAALEADAVATAAGVDYVVVERASEPKAVNIGGADYLFVDFDVEVVG